MEKRIKTEEFLRSSVMEQLNQENAKPEWYENFIDKYDYQSPKPGQLISGDIISIDDDGILVDIGLKRDALIPAKDLSQIDSSIISALEIGNHVSIYVLARAEGDRELQVSLSKGIEFASWKKAEAARDAILRGVRRLQGILAYGRSPESP